MSNRAERQKLCFLLIFAVCAMSVGADWAAKPQRHRKTSVVNQSGNIPATILQATSTLATSATSANNEPPVDGENQVADGGRTPSEDLEEIERELEQLAEQEVAARDIWIERYRKLATLQQKLLLEDDELRELQDRIQYHSRKTEELQSELDRELLERSEIADKYPDAPSQDELQDQIIAMRSKRSELIRRRNRLQQQILAAERAADSE